MPGSMRSWRALPLAVALLSVATVAGCTASSTTTARGTATPADVAGGCQGCYAPVAFRVAYGIQPLMSRGIDGRGETVTVLAAALPLHAPASQPPAQGPGVGDIRHDLAAFDRMFRLPAAPIKVVTTLAGAGSPRQASVEEAQDVEMVHAVAPAATLRVVLLPTNFLASAAEATAEMIAGLRLAVSGTDVALISWSLGEHFFTKAQLAQLHSILLGAQAHHVTVVAASGGNGEFSDAWFGGTPPKEVSLPASDPLVLAVGGTTLTADPATGAYVSETTWNGQASLVQSNGASGGGFSRLYARPAYQDGVPGISAMRGVPDVAGDAGQQDGLSIVFAGGGPTSVSPDQGTAAATPLWAGVMALADQYAHHDLGSVNPAIYRVARGSSYRRAFHDITTGSNVLSLPWPGGMGGYQAGPGWDPVTGWGTPDAQVLVPLLAA